MPATVGQLAIHMVLQVQSMDYSCVVFDTAPTGHTLRLLQLPAMMDKALGKLVGMRGMLGGLLGQVGPSARAGLGSRVLSASLGQGAMHLLGF